MAGWATEAEVAALTGVSVDAADLAVAQGVVDLFSGVTYDADATLSARNRRLLRMAVAYQAAWMDTQVDVLARVGVQVVEQDGVKVTPSDREALVLAPLARLALASLSWRQAGTVTARRGHHGRYLTLEDYTTAWMRDETYEPWRCL